MLVYCLEWYIREQEINDVKERNCGSSEYQRQNIIKTIREKRQIAYKGTVKLKTFWQQEKEQNNTFKELRKK